MKMKLDIYWSWYNLSKHYICRQISVGPTAVNYLMSYDYAGGSPFKVVTLSFWAGLIEMLAGFLNLGFIIQFISKPVLAAFSNVVAIKVNEKPSIVLLNLYH